MVAGGPTAGERSGAVGPAAQTPPDPAAVYRDVYALARHLLAGSPLAEVAIEIRPVGSSSPTRIVVPPRPAPDPPADGLAGEIAVKLEEVGDWCPRQTLILLLGENRDHTSGAFGRAIRKLKDAGRIVSDRHRGYCLAEYAEG